MWVSEAVAAMSVFTGTHNESMKRLCTSLKFMFLPTLVRLLAYVITERIQAVARMSTTQLSAPSPSAIKGFGTYFCPTVHRLPRKAWTTGSTTTPGNATGTVSQHTQYNVDASLWGWLIRFGLRLLGAFLVWQKKAALALVWGDFQQTLRWL